MNLGKSIRLVRTEQGLSQEEFATRYHVTRQTVSNWENDKNYPDLTTLVQLSEDFHISLDRLLKENNQIVKKMDRECRQAKCWKKVAAVMAVLLLAAALGIWYLSQAMKPTANALRNMTDTDVTMYLNLPDSTPSRAVIRTFDKEKYDNFSISKKMKIRGQIAGNLEGDIPTLHLPEGDTMRFVFQDVSYENLLPVIPPEITLTVYANTSVIPKDDRLFTEPMKKHRFTLEQDENGYYFQYPEDLQKTETVVNCLLEVTYTINGRDYISLTAFCAENLPDY